MECIPIIIAREKWRRWFYELLFVMPMKSSTNNSRRFMNDAVPVSWWLVKYCDVSSILLLKGCYGRLTHCRRASITYHAVSEAAKKKGGYSYHPICR